MPRTLLWILGLIALVAVAAAALLALNPTVVGHRLAGWVSSEIGRQLTLDGRVELRFGRTLTIGLDGLRLANAAWGSRADMLSVGRVLVEIDSWSLLDRPLLIRRIEVENFDLLLERTGDGENNWKFDRRGGRGAWPDRLPLVLEQVTMPGARIRFIGPRLTRPLDLQLETLTQQQGPDGLLVFTSSGAANETAFSAQASAGPVDALVAGRNFSVELSAGIADLSLEARAQIDDIARPRDSRLLLALRGADADQLREYFGVRNLGSGPVRLEASVVPLPDGRGVGGSVEGAIGQFQLKADGRLAEPLTMDELALQLAISGPDLSLVGGLVGLNRLPVSPFDLALTLDRSGERLRIVDGRLVLPDSRLELKGEVQRVRVLAGNDLEFRLQGTDVARFRELLRLPGLAEGPFELSGRLHESPAGAERLEVKATTSLGGFELAGQLGRYPDYYGTRLSFDAVGDSLARVGNAAGIAGLPAAKYQASGELEWQPSGLIFRRSNLRSGGNELTLSGSFGKALLGPDTDLRFSLRGGELRGFSQLAHTDRLPAGAFSVQGRMRRDRQGLRFDDVRGSVAEAVVNLRGRIGAQPAEDTDVTISVEGPKLEAFAGLLPGYRLPPGPFSLSGGVLLSAQKVQLRDLRFAAAGAEGSLRANLDLPLDRIGGGFEVRARGGDLAALLPQVAGAGSLVRDFDLLMSATARDGSLTFEAARLTSSAGSIEAGGRLAWQPDFSATALRLQVRAASLADAGALVGVELPAEPFEFTAQVSGTRDFLQVTEATGRVGASDFAGHAALDLRARRVRDLRLESTLLDLRPFLDGDETPAPDAAVPSGARLIPDRPLPLALLDHAEGTLSVRASRALILDETLQDVSLQARLQAGGILLQDLSMRVQGQGSLSASGELRRRPEGAEIRFELTGDDIPLGPAGDTAEQRAARPRADLTLQLSGRGDTVSEFARTVDGQLRLSSGPGEVPFSSSPRLWGNLRRELVAAVRPKARERTKGAVRCLAVAVNAADGVVSTAPVVAMQTQDVNVVGYGVVDLRTEQVDFYLKTTPRGRLDISLGEIVNPYVKVGGTLAQPRLAVDPKGALFSGAAAVVTGGLSVVARGAWDRLFRSRDPCDAALAAADRLAEEPESPVRALQKLLRTPLGR